ncbi:unnamed protein product [Dicrocoelium dendriticum]|nr:unnamed protein product [Dicrocoelium dendriticum]
MHLDVPRRPSRRTMLHAITTAPTQHEPVPPPRLYYAGLHACFGLHKAFVNHGVPLEVLNSAVHSVYFMNGSGATWQLHLCDPASVACEELLEYDIVCGRCFPCDPKPRHCSCETRIIKPRSRSEDNRCWRKQQLSACSSGSDLSFSGFHPGSCCNSGFCSTNSGSCFMDDDVTAKVPDPDVTQGLYSPSLPPPMRTIHLNLPGFQNLESDSSGSLKRTGHLPTSPFRTENYHDLVWVSVPSATTSSTTPNAGAISVLSDCTSNSLYATRSSREFRTSSRLRPPVKSPTLDVSARDSGLSSHSSSSTCFYGSVHNVTTGEPSESSSYSVSPTPPPVPPHAPKSRAATATASPSDPSSLLKKEPVDHCQTSTDYFPENRLKGHTIRLSHGPKEPGTTPIRSVPPAYLTESLRFIDDPEVSDETSSPIWKRKHPEVLDSSLRDHSPASASDYKSVILCSNSPNVPKAAAAVAGIIPAAATSKALLCDQCEMAELMFFTAKQTPVNIDRSALREPLLSSSCEICRRLLLNVGVNLFNRDPLQSLDFLERYGFLQADCPKTIASFIRTAPNLCRSQLGAFLGLPNCPRTSPSKVMHHLLQALNFKGLEVDEALRLTVHHFGMPLESQEIDRFLECLADVYYAVRWPTTAPISRHQILLLFYSVLLLQTSLHNESAAKSSLGKQTVATFIKNCQNFIFDSSIPHPPIASPSRGLGSDDVPEDRNVVFSHANLSAIYRRIKGTPIVPGTDHTHLTSRIARSLIFPRSRSKLDHLHDLEGVDLQMELVKPQHRVVFSCAVLQLSRRSRTGVQVGFLRQVILFNDLVLLVKLMRPDKSRIRGKRDLRLRRELSSLLRGAVPSGPGRFLVHNFQTWQIGGHGTIDPVPVTTTVFGHLSSTPCLPVRGRQIKTCQEHILPTVRNVFKSIAIRGIPLLGCVIRPFRTQECCFGLEIWKHDNSQSESSHGNASCDAPCDSGCWQLVAVLAALSHADYGHFLSLLLDSLRETHLVHQELMARRNSLAVGHM